MNTKNVSASELKTSEFLQVCGPDLDPICLTLRWYFEKVDFEKNRQTTKKGQRIKLQRLGGVLEFMMQTKALIRLHGSSGVV